MAKTKGKPAKKAAKEAAPAKAAKPTPAKAEKAAKAKAAKATVSIEQDILNVTGAKPQGKSEDFGAYARRLAQAIDKKDEHFDSLGEPAQLWFAAAAKAINKDADPPAFDAEGDEVEEAPAKAAAESEEAEAEGEVEAEAETETEAETNDEEEDMATKAKKGKAKKAAPAKAAKKAAPAKAPAAKKSKANGAGKGNSATAKLTALICQDLDADYDDLVKRAKKSGLDLGDVTMYAVFNRVHLAVSALRAAGKMK